ncbi:GNAT family N-acetyltransferase [Asaia astilbis]|uniref:GNAT family N-acetyltransferase n=1 Tax=Asaia astilbis TaxID=610244 RepID=UPI001E51D767|nr:GNAT family N-acetyltransferase [Asaia astilbis]
MVQPAYRHREFTLPDAADSRQIVADALVADRVVTPHSFTTDATSALDFTEPQAVTNRDRTPSSAVTSIRPVISRKDLKTFITLPRVLYKGLDGYKAPLDMEQNDLLDPKRNPIFRHASIRYFMAWRDGMPVGRIAAIVDGKALDTWDEKIGWFGAIDALPERGILKALFDAAEGWLRDQGMQRMRGPVTLGYHGESGLMVTGQTESPMIGTPWHPPELHSLIEELGLETGRDLLTFKLDLTDDLDDRHIVPGALKPGQGKLGEVSVSHLSKKQITAQGEVLRSLYNDAWAGTYNFVPLQSYEMDALIAQLKLVLRPEHYVQIDHAGEPAAMALVVPNIYDVLQGIEGAPSPLGWAKLGARLLSHRFESARVILLGVSHKVRGTLLGALMPSLAIDELIRRRATLPYKSVELGWILDTNLPMLNLVKRLVPEPNKTHRIYEKEISQS